MTSTRASLLYASQLRAGLSASAVAAITRQAREHNSIAGITGLLIFDGETFAQYIEGPSDAVTALQDRIERDPRHQNFVVSAAGPATDGRRFPGWDLGFLMADIGDGGIEQLLRLRGSRAVAAFMALVPSLDTSISTATPV